MNGDFNHQEISLNPQEMFHSLKDGHFQSHFYIYIENIIDFLVGVVGLEPTRLSAPDPKSGVSTIPPHSEKTHSNDFRSHICQNPDGFIAPSTRTKVPYLYLYTLVSPHL